MTDVNIAKAHQEATKAKAIWDNRKFAELLDYDPKAAAQYAIDCNIKTEIYGIAVEDYVKWVRPWTEEKETVEEVVEEISEPIEEVEETEEVEEITKEDLQELLKANNIKYHHAAGVKKLTELANEKGLM